MLKLTVAVLLLISTVKSDGDGHGASGHDLFAHYDSSHDNQIRITEFRNLFMGFDAWPEDGQVSEHEFVAGWTGSQSELDQDQSAVLFFLRTDLDHNGRVSSNEVDQLFHMFDEDGNNAVGKQEFCDAFSAMYYAIDKC